jgi:hypothetical protein
LTIEVDHPAGIVSIPAVPLGEIEAFVSPGLVIQHIGKDGTVWSTRGFYVYKSSDGIKFKMAFKVPSGGLINWMGHSRYLRELSDYYEICEVFPLRSGTILAFSGGNIWRSTGGGNDFRQVHSLRHFGIKKGRGVLPQGITEDLQGAFYYGEYFRNSERNSVFVYRSMDDGKNWKVVYRFNPGEIRHIHSLQVDPYTNALWIATGDDDHEPMIGYSRNQGETFHKVGSGSQKWRAVSLLFTQEAVFWGTDSSLYQNWIYRWDRKIGEAKPVCKVDGPIFYSTKLQDGTLIMGRTVEGEKGEWDDMVSIWVSQDGKQWVRKILGKRKSPDAYAFLRFARGNSAAHLYTSIFNTGDHEEALLKIPIKSILK